MAIFFLNVFYTWLSLARPPKLTTVRTWNLSTFELRQQFEHCLRLQDVSIIKSKWFSVSVFVWRNSPLMLWTANSCVTLIQLVAVVSYLYISCIETTSLTHKVRTVLKIDFKLAHSRSLSARINELCESFSKRQRRFTFTLLNLLLFQIELRKNEVFWLFSTFREWIFSYAVISR